MNIDDDLVKLYQEHRASEMSERSLFIELLIALEGESVSREKALALIYELRDRSDAMGGNDE